MSAGLKIKGYGETLPESPSFGDCFLQLQDGVYHLMIYMNPWVDLGRFPAVGPQGVPGQKGDPAVISFISCAARAIDFGLAPSVSATVSPNGETISFSFELPIGPQGTQGPQGIQGETGPQGPQGPQGEPGNSIRLYQNPSVLTVSDLPAAATAGAGVGYLVGTVGNYELYVTANNPLEWVDAGPFYPETVVVDAYFSLSSTNPVRNELVTLALGQGLDPNDTISVGDEFGAGSAMFSILSLLSPFELDNVKYSFIEMKTVEYEGDELTAAVYQGMTSDSNAKIKTITFVRTLRYFIPIDISEYDVAFSDGTYPDMIVGHSMTSSHAESSVTIDGIADAASDIRTLKAENALLKANVQELAAVIAGSVANFVITPTWFSSNTTISGSTATVSGTVSGSTVTIS